MTTAWLLSCFGLTWIITRSVIFARVRAIFPKPMGTTPFYGTLLRCPQCMGFWVGVVHSIAFFPVVPVAAPGIAPRVLEAVFSGFVASGACYLAMLVCEKLGQGPLDELASPDANNHLVRRHGYGRADRESGRALGLGRNRG